MYNIIYHSKSMYMEHSNAFGPGEAHKKKIFRKCDD